MPPKAKFTREEIVEVAFQLAREKGSEAVVAREVGKKLGTSSSPIFTAFRNMEELQNEVKVVAMKKFEEYVNDALNYSPAFKYVGIQMVRFSIEEPNLFEILFMRRRNISQSYDEFIEELGPTMQVCVTYIKEEHMLNDEEAFKLFREVWLQTFSVCTLLAKKVCNFTEKEISEILSLSFQGTLQLIKSDQFKDVPIKLK